MPILAAIDYSVFPPINAALNSLSCVLLITGLILIKSGRPRAHKVTMLAALVTSAIFLGCYLFYHYGTGHTEFPKEYPTARKIYLAILLPHIVLAVVNLPFIIMLVVAAFREKFERHKKIARIIFPSWLFVSITGVVIYFMLYHWFLPGDAAASTSESSSISENAPASQKVLEEEMNLGDLIFRPGFQSVKARAGQEAVEVQFYGTNRSQSPIKMKMMESGCACLSVTIDQDPVPAGKTAILTGIFDTTKMRGSSDKKILVSTEQHPQAKFLTTRIEITPVYMIEPSMTSWKIGEQPASKTVKFRVTRKEPIRILTAESKRMEVTCEVEVVEEGRAYNLHLTPKGTEQALLGIVRIETDCELEHYANPLAYFSIK